MSKRLFPFILMIISFSKVLGFQAEDSNKSLFIKVVDKSTKQGIVSATVILEPYKIWGISDDNGLAEIDYTKIDKKARCAISVNLLGYKNAIYEIDWNTINPDNIIIEIEEESLAIEGAIVVAQNSKSGVSTASKIGRQAIDHLQATSLKDVIQLLPGQIISSNPSLTNAGSLQIRTLQNNNSNNSFGASIMVDGIPVSNNASMNTSLNSLYSDGGVDLRSIGTDDIESIEIIRGIASAEYGDLSSGAMIINSKIGISNLNIKAKIMPGISQFYAGKGFKLGNGSINITGDYARGKSDPRYTSDTYDRAIVSVIHSDFLFDNKLSLTTKFTAKGIYEWEGADPDEPEAMQKYFSRRKQLSFTLIHSGKINLNKLFSRTIKYDLSYTNDRNSVYKKELSALGGGVYADAAENGTFKGVAYPSVYELINGTKSKPVNFYAKIANNFNITTNNFSNNFNMGAVYTLDGNKGIGSYDDGSDLPSVAPKRIRAFKDIPYLHQISAYLEDNITVNYGDKKYPYLKAQLGIRWNLIQPGMKEQMHSFSPRINSTLHISDLFALRFGYGIAEKTPSLSYLYPEKEYYDYLNININDGVNNYYLYTTSVFDKTNPSLKPMRNTKYEAGLDLTPGNGMSFSIIGYYEKIKNGFSTDNSVWLSMIFDKWSGNDVTITNNDIEYDASAPTCVDTVLYNLTRPGNTEVHISKGIEFDFNLGKINSTKTSFYLNGAYSQTKYNSSNLYYKLPTGTSKTYGNVYTVYGEGAGSFKDIRRFSSALRVVQQITAINLIVSATIQAVIYDYNQTIDISTKPIGYIKNEKLSGKTGGTVYIPFTDRQFADPTYKFEGYMLKDQSYGMSTSTLPVTWPFIWNMNLRVTKDINKYLGFSFYVNNALFYQPWQTSSTASNPIERNASLFSYGIEMYINF